MRWLHKVDVSLEWGKALRKELDIPDLVSIMVPKLREKGAPEDLLEDLLDTYDPADFDEVWSRVYDWADENSVWIETHRVWE